MKARAALLSLFVVAVAGCSGGSSGGDGNAAQTESPSASGTSSPSASPSETPSESPTPTPSFSSTVQASHRCKTAQLSLSLGDAQGAAGSTILPVVLTNKGSDACRLYGRPGVSFLDGNGNQLGVSALPGGDQAATVTLAPTASANALVQIPNPGNFSAADCAPANAAQLRVYPPGDYAALTVAYQSQVCTTQQGAAMVSPVTPGSGG